MLDKLTVCLDKFCDLIKDRTERDKIMVISPMDSLPRTGSGKINFKLVEEYDSNNFKLNKGTYRVRKR